MNKLEKLNKRIDPWMEKKIAEPFFDFVGKYGAIMVLSVFFILFIVVVLVAVF